MRAYNELTSTWRRMHPDRGTARNSGPQQDVKLSLCKTIETHSIRKSYESDFFSGALAARLGPLSHHLLLRLAVPPQLGPHWNAARDSSELLLLAGSTPVMHRLCPPPPPSNLLSSRQALKYTNANRKLTASSFILD